MDYRLKAELEKGIEVLNLNWEIQIKERDKYKIFIYGIIVIILLLKNTLQLE
jgi:hypothetical protein